MYVSERRSIRATGGRFDRLRKAAMFWLLGMYYVFPWLEWDGRRAVLFDLPAHQVPRVRADLLAAGFQPARDPADHSLALTLFFVTALAGRLWCGYACRQTVWTGSFLWMERWTEGDRRSG